MAETRTPSAIARVMRKVLAATRACVAKAFFDQRVGGEKFAAKISGQQQQDNEHAADQVAKTS